MKNLISKISFLLITLFVLQIVNIHAPFARKFVFFSAIPQLASASIETCAVEIQNADLSTNNHTGKKPILRRIKSLQANSKSCKALDGLNISKWRCHEFAKTPFVPFINSYLKLRNYLALNFTPPLSIVLHNSTILLI